MLAARDATLVHRNCRKVPFATASEARHQAQYYARRTRRSGALYAYRCAECGMFHITSLPTSKQGRVPPKAAHHRYHHITEEAT